LPFSQNLIFLSWDPVINLLAEIAHVVTACEWSAKVFNIFPVLISQTLADPSQLPEIKQVGSYWDIELTVKVCPWYS